MAVVDELGEEVAGNLARRSLCYRGIIPHVFNFVGDYKEQMKYCIKFAKEDLGIINSGDRVVGIHALGGASVLKVVEVP